MLVFPDSNCTGTVTCDVCVLSICVSSSESVYFAVIVIIAEQPPVVVVD